MSTTNDSPTKRIDKLEAALNYLVEDVNLDSVLNLLSNLEITDQERLGKAFYSGQISQVEFVEEVLDKGFAIFIELMRLHQPTFPYPDPNDKNPDLKEWNEKFQEAFRIQENERQALLQTVRRKAPLVVNSILDDWETLQSIRGANSEVLNRRWMKKTIEKRKNILSRAWPEMNPVHRPEYDIIQRKLKGPLHRDALLMPFINLEDLCASKNLLNMIQSRASVPPEHFAFSDSAGFPIAIELEAVKDTALNGTIMLLTGQKTRATYGTLKTCKSQTEKEDHVYAGFGFKLDQGFIILQNQKKIYSFLVRCVELLLHDIDLSATAAKKMDEVFEQERSIGFTETWSDSKEWHSISEINTQACYGLPQPFSVESVRKWAGARRDEAEDNFWALHEDPAYFVEQLVNFHGQNLELSRRTINETPSRSSHKVDDMALHYDCADVVFYSYRDVVIWDAIMTYLTRLEHAKANLKVEIQLSKRLPRDYELALGSFICLMSAVWIYATKDLYRSLMSCPSFQEFYEVVSEEDGSQSLRLNEATSDRWPLILKLLNTLVDIRTVEIWGGVNILDKMERIIESDSVQYATMGTNIRRQISRMAAFSHIWDTLRRHQPAYVGSHQESYKDLHRDCISQFKVIDELEDIIPKLRLSAHTKPRSAFDYPAGRKRTLQHVKQMQHAESKLDAFWSQVDLSLVRKTGKTLREWLGSKLTAREIQRTPPWIPEEAQQRRVKGNPLPMEFFDFGANLALESSEKIPTEIKTKPKTRGEAYPSPESSSTEPMVVPEEAKSPVQIFRLPKKAFKTIATFYPTSVEDRTSRKVQWKDFLHVMYSLDFEIEKRHGSEWYFEPTWKRNAPITVHEPHPSHEMNFDKIRFEANRMARKYGWSADSFQVK
ncbi:hypothetical protein G7Y79_00079g100340 [Physcia stellaris]|nr:hypothetical protein G7Y79_00079g100340 [Physcia stellaris]